jgi:hypothetical protein
MAELTNLLSIKLGTVIFLGEDLSTFLDLYLTLFNKLKPNNQLAVCGQSDIKN